MKDWQLQEAKAHFSRVVRYAVTKGPQYVSVRGEPTVVILSQKNYDQLTKPKLSLVDFMQKSPLKGLDLNIK